MTKKGFKYFIGYKDDKKVRPLCIMFLKMSANRRDFHETKWMSFLIKDAELLEKYNEIWDKVSNNVKKGSDSEPVYNHKYLKSKKKSCKGKSTQVFMVIRHQNKFLIVFVCQYHWLILSLE